MLEYFKNKLRRSPKSPIPISDSSEENLLDEQAAVLLKPKTLRELVPGAEYAMPWGYCGSEPRVYSVGHPMHEEMSLNPTYGILEGAQICELSPLTEKYSGDMAKQIAARIIGHEAEQGKQKLLEIDICAEEGGLGEETLALILKSVQELQKTQSDPHEHVLISGDLIPVIQRIYHDSNIRDRAFELMNPAAGVWTNHSHILVINATGCEQDRERLKKEALQDYQAKTKWEEGLGQITIIWYEGDARYATEGNNYGGVSKDPETGKEVYLVPRVDYTDYRDMLPQEWREEAIEKSLAEIFRGNFNFLSTALNAYNQQRARGKDSVSFTPEFAIDLMWQRAVVLGVDPGLVNMKNRQLLQRLLLVAPLSQSNGSLASNINFDELAMRMFPGMPKGDAELIFRRLSETKAGFYNWNKGACGSLFYTRKKVTFTDESGQRLTPYRVEDNFIIDPHVLGILRFLGAERLVADEGLFREALDKNFIAVACARCGTIREALVGSDNLIHPHNDDNCTQCGAPEITLVCLELKDEQATSR